MEFAMVHMDDDDRNRAPEKYGKKVYNKAVAMIEQARPLSDNPTLLLSEYAHKLILLYLKDEGIGMESVKSLGGCPVEIVANHIEGNHALASIGIQVTQ